ncbi:MAG TPA: PKD domain-containing protein, partial [Polyangiaceae bacterium]|nr:PKD domain-containing protein [Polyangiaceae bacterium]
MRRSARHDIVTALVAVAVCALLVACDGTTVAPPTPACDGSTGCEDAGGEAGSCVAGLSCPLADLCALGVTRCVQGQSVCVHQATAADGTPCGTGAVCEQGSCSGCADAGACTPVKACRTGTLSCNGMVTTCLESGNAPNGIACGAGGTCVAGECVVCEDAGAACTPSEACKTGTLSCGDGSASQCMATGNVVDGTPCSSDQVCSAGACVPCVDESSCAPANPCHAGTMSCSDGPVSCVDTGKNVNDGTSCGPGSSCENGACIACAESAPCVPANPCHAGSISCSTGTAICVDSMQVAIAGTQCGDGGACTFDGVCAICSSGASCTPSLPCYAGTTVCTQGSSQCVLSNRLPDGTGCGPALECVNGACLSPVSVTATSVPPSVEPGVPFTAELAVVLEPLAPADAGAPMVTIDWGDGSTSPGTLSGGPTMFTVVGTHTYATSGVATVQISATDPTSGATVSVSLSVPVGVSEFALPT